MTDRDLTDSYVTLGNFCCYYTIKIEYLTSQGDGLQKIRFKDFITTGNVSEILFIEYVNNM
jgi:hypothetical protein